MRRKPGSALLVEDSYALRLVKAGVAENDTRTKAQLLDWLDEARPGHEYSMKNTLGDLQAAVADNAEGA